MLSMLYAMRVWSEFWYDGEPCCYSNPSTEATTQETCRQPAVNQITRKAFNEDIPLNTDMSLPLNRYFYLLYRFCGGEQSFYSFAV